MTGMREIATALRERADFVDRDTYDECWEVKETPHGALLRQAASAIDSLSSQVAELREALKPFALHPERDNQSLPDQWQVSRNPEITMGDLRRARSALSLGST